MKRIIFLVFLGIVAVFAACSTGPGGVEKENQPPTVWLSAGPPEGSVGKYRVQMYWGGWDPDGEIAGYEYIVTDNETGTFNPADTVGVDWNPVAGNDSVFVFSADTPVDSLNNSELIAEFVRSHTFFVRAVDREGLRSRRPAHRSFTSRTLSPTVVIDIPKRNFYNPAVVPAISTFRWHADDPVDDLLVIQEPESVQWALLNTADPDVPGGGANRFDEAIAYLRTPDASDKWYPWVYYRAPEDSGKFWTTPPQDLGTYVFAIRAKDEAGAITPVLDEDSNWRRVKVSLRDQGPKLRVINEYMGVLYWDNCAPPLTILDMPAGVPLEFRVNADASHYGGTVAGYRYGWDIPDLNDPEQWEIDLTPFLPGTTTAAIPPRAFFFGTHTLTIEVVDNSGYCTRVQIKVNIVQFTLERSVLIVDDDTTDDTSNGWQLTGHPTDPEHDAFWLDMVSDVSGFDPELDMVNTNIRDLPLTQLAQYKSIIWSVYGSNDKSKSSTWALLYDFIKYRPRRADTGQTVSSGKVKPNVLALAMAAGGHVMLAGRHPVQHAIDRNWFASTAKFPFIWLWDLEGDQALADAPQASSVPVGDLSFAYRELCLESMDYAYVRNTLWRRSSGNNREYCPVSTVRRLSGSERNHTMRQALPLDTAFPLLGLRPEAAGPGGWFDPDVRGVDCEVYNPFYFQRGSGRPGSCTHVNAPRPCFEPIYGLGCNDTTEPVYNQTIAYWTSAYADRVADVPGAVGARSVVFGFQPVVINPDQFQTVMDRILFDEWQLPRGGNATATVGTAAPRSDQSRE